MEDLFSQEMLGKKKNKCAWAGASATNYVTGAFILDRELGRLFLDRGQGAASETFDVSDYLTNEIKLRIGHHTNG